MSPRPGEPDAAEAGGVLLIDLGAIVRNWRALAELCAPATCAAVVKADAYGLGIEQVAPALFEAGCRTFFVAHLSEGRTLRAILGGDGRDDPRILVLNGVPPGTAAAFADADLVPVLNSASQIVEWSALGRDRGTRLPAALQVDSGMSRFGLPPEEAERLAREPDRLSGIEPVLLMSHLGCADEPDHPANAAQRETFARLRTLFPALPASLAASFGIALGPDWHLDMVRPGVALYGLDVPGLPPGTLRPVVRLQGRIAQLRDIPAGAFVGYGARFRAGRATRVATVAVGYADGLLRASGNGVASVSHPDGGFPLPLIGRISMDSLAVDVTALPADALREGDRLDLIGPHRLLERAAAEAGTIGYELLTALGRRYHRHYLPPTRVADPMRTEQPR